MTGISNATIITMEHLVNITNTSSVPELFVNVNNYIYGGWLFFILLCVFWIILFFSAQQRENQVLTNAMYSGAVVSLASFFLRAIIVLGTDGITRGLLSDHQLWIFPLLTIIFATILWLTKSN